MKKRRIFNAIVAMVVVLELVMTDISAFAQEIGGNTFFDAQGEILGQENETPTPEPTESMDPGENAQESSTPEETVSPVVSPGVAATPETTPEETASPGAEETIAPVVSPSASLEPSTTVEPGETGSPESTNSPENTEEPSLLPSEEPTGTPTAEASITPSATPVVSPTSSATPSRTPGKRSATYASAENQYVIGQDDWVSSNNYIYEHVYTDIDTNAQYDKTQPFTLHIEIKYVQQETEYNSPALSGTYINVYLPEGGELTCEEKEGIEVFPSQNMVGIPIGVLKSNETFKTSITLSLTERERGTLNYNIGIVTYSDTYGDMSSSEWSISLGKEFSTQIDGWSFVNGGQGFGYSAEYIIPIARYEEVFGKAYTAAAAISGLKYDAEHNFQLKDHENTVFNSMIETTWGGNCFGMSVLATLLWSGRLQISNYVSYDGTTNKYYNGIKSSLFDGTYTYVNYDDAITKLIEEYQILQKGKPEYEIGEETTFHWLAAGEDQHTYIPEGYIEKVVSFIESRDYPLTISLKGKIFGGHRIVLKNEQKTDMGNGWIRYYVYDPNSPYSTIDGNLASYYISDPGERYIEFNIEKNQWRYFLNAGDRTYIGSDSAGNRIETDYFYIADFLADETYPTAFNGDCVWWNKYEEKLKAYISGNAHFRLVESDTGEQILEYVGNSIFIEPKFVNSVRYIPHVSTTVDGNFSQGGILEMPQGKYRVEYLGGDDISFVDDNSVLNVASDGNLLLDIDMIEDTVLTASESDNVSVVKFSNIHSNNEYSSAEITGELKAGDQFTLQLKDDSLSVKNNISGESNLAVYVNSDERDSVEKVSELTCDTADIYIPAIRSNSTKDFNGGILRENCTLQSDKIIETDVQIESGARLNLNGFSLTINGNLTVNSGTVDISGGVLNVSGNVKGGEKCYISGGTFNITGDIDTSPIMKNQADVLNVYGTASIEIGSQNITSGKIYIRGNASLGDGYVQDNNANDVEVYICGNTLQSIEFTAKGTSTSGKGLRKFYIQNANVLMQDAVMYLMNTAEINGGSSLENVVLNGYQLSVNGDATVNKIDLLGGTLTVNGNAPGNNDISFNKGKTYVTGDFNYSGFSMINDEDTLEVRGTFTDNAMYNSDDKLKAGMTIFGGDVIHTFPQGNHGDLFSCEGTHKTIFNGKGKQRVYSDPGDGNYNIVEILNPEVALEGSFEANKITSDITFNSNNAKIYITETNGHSITINGDADFASAVNLQGGTLEANGNLKCNFAAIKFGGGKIHTTGDLTVYGSTGEISEENIIDVDGDLVLDHSILSLSEGTLYLAGDLITYTEDIGGYNVKHPFSGNHTTVLDGLGTQTISSNCHFDRFNKLQVSNGQTIKFTHFLGFTKLLSDISADSADEALEIYDSTYNVLDLNGYTLKVNGSLTVDQYYKSQININEGLLSVTGDLNHIAGIIDVAKGMLFISGDYNYSTDVRTSDLSLIMSNAEDVVDIRGNMNVHGDMRNLQAGVWKLGGNLYAGYTGTNSTAVAEIICTGTNKIIFDGSQEQTITLSESSMLNEAEFQNDRIAVDEWFNMQKLLTDARINANSVNARLGWVGLNGKTLAINGDVEIRAIIKRVNNSAAYADDYIDLAGGQIKIEGNLKHSAGIIYFNGGQIQVTGSYSSIDPSIAKSEISLGYGDDTSVERWGSCALGMNDDADVLDVDGNFSITSNGWNSKEEYTRLTAGTVYVGGNIDIHAEEKGAYDYPPRYDMSGTNIFVLDGEGKQSVKMDTNGSEFNIVKLTMPTGNYSFSPEHCWKKLIEFGGEEDPEEPDWYKDWEYTVSGSSIVLKQFKEGMYGTNTKIVVPAAAVIDGKKYEVILQGTNTYYTATFPEAVTSITIRRGVKAAENISYLFSACKNLTELNMDGFITSNTTDMGNLFSHCESLPSIDMSKMDTSNVTDMGGMFSSCKNLTELNLSGVDTTNVKDMSSMFYYCSSLTTVDVSGFDTSMVRDFGQMFEECASLKTLDVSGFITDKADRMYGMFNGCSQVSELNVSGFNTASVQYFDYMFADCNALMELDLSSFQTTEASSMSGMFSGCWNLAYLDLKYFDTSNITDMTGMFSSCYKLRNVDMTGFDTRKVTSFSSMFSYCKNLEMIDTTQLSTDSAGSLSYMFAGCTTLSTIDISGFKTDHVTKLNSLFAYCHNLQSINLGNLNTENVVNMSNMFEDCYALSQIDLTLFDTGKVTNMNSMFKNCYYLSTLDLSGFNTANVSDMGELFSGCKSLKDINFPEWRTDKVSNIKNLFQGCEQLETIDLSQFDLSSVTSLEGMFANCSALKQINWGEKQLSKVTDMSSMFAYCFSLESVSLDRIETSNVTNMQSMFRECNSLATIDIDHFDTTKVSNFGYMFDGCTSLTELDLSSFDMCSAGTYTLRYMLRNTTALHTIKTPIHVPASVQESLAYEYADASGNRYTVLPQNENISITLTRCDTPEISVTSLTINERVTGMKVNSISTPIAVTCYPTNATNKRVKYESMDGSIATVDAGGRVHSYDKYGTVDVKVSSMSNPEICETITIKVYNEIIKEIALEPEALTLGEGEQTRMNAKVTDGNKTYLYGDFKWKSSNESVASVNEYGIVTAEAEGIAEITCTYAYDSTVSAVAPVTVVKREPVKSLRIDKNAVSIKKDEHIRLSTVILPENATNQNVIWRSSNTEVATVNGNGIVSGISAGEAIITAVAGENNEIFDTCNITVTAARVPVEFIYMEQYSERIQQGESMKLKVKFYPENADNKRLVWSTSNASIATVDQDGNVTGHSEGTVYIKATAEDGGYTATCSVMVYAVQLTEICLNSASKFMIVGDTDLLEVDHLPTNAEKPMIIWSSSAPQIVSVDENGQIQALQEGNADIIASVSDGSLEAICSVSVFAEAVNVQKDIWVYGIKDYSYTGNKIAQDIRVFDGERELLAGIDYTISYKNNINAYVAASGDSSFNAKKAPQITLKMKGNYSGSKTVYFRIYPADISGEDFSADDLAVTYTGKKQTPAAVLKWNGRKLKCNVDYAVIEYENAKSDKTAFSTSGSYVLTLEGQKNFKGTRTINLLISADKNQIAMDKVSVKGISKCEWTGEQIKPDNYILTYKKGILTAEDEFKVEYGLNTDVGEGTIVFKGTGVDTDGDGFSYIGSKTVTFKITGITMSKVKVTPVQNVLTYDGSKVEPEYILTYQENKKSEIQVLTVDKDYTVEFSKNINKGTGTVFFTGINKFSGTLKKTFKINARNMNDSAITINNGNAIRTQYVKGGCKPSVCVMYGNRLLEEGTDYTVKYSNNTKLYLDESFSTKGAPVITITGKGNFTGKKTVNFTISRANMNQVVMSAVDKAYNGTAGGYITKVTLTDRNGKTLKAGTDYDKDLQYYLVHDNGTEEYLGKKAIVNEGAVIKVTTYGKGCYDNPLISTTYRILAKNCDISKGTFKVNSKQFLGRNVAITITEGDISKAVIGKTPLRYGIDYEIVDGSYVNNTNKGTAKVTIRGIGQYGGTKTVTFKISAKAITN